MVDWGDDYEPTLRETLWGSVFIIALIAMMVIVMFVWGSL